jgi:hypothetical protein
MKTVFVYYSDGYYDNGDVGLEEFSNRAEAEKFIVLRMAADARRTLGQYTVIEGCRLKPRATEVVKVVRIEDY